jgi:hypothetical protein
MIVRATMVAAFALAAVAANAALASRSGGPAPTPVACGATFKTSAIRTSFSVPLSVALPPHWCAVAGGAPGTFGLIHVGTPVTDDRQWWGPDVMLVNGARVHRPSDAVSSKPAASDSTTFVPWPTDFFRYLTALPGVKVLAGPKPTTIGGLHGTQISVATPPMHPLIWMKNDFTWYGGGATGVDATAKRQYILVTVGHNKLLLSFADSPAAFAAHTALLRPVYQGIKFGS